MIFCYIFLVVPLLTFLHDARVLSCDYNCADKPVFTPSRLVVKYQDPTSVNCSVCQHACLNKTLGLEKSIGEISEKKPPLIVWTVNRMTEWETSVICYYTANQCCRKLPITVYQPPDNVSISFFNHSGLMLEGHQYTLQCTVQNVAPVENLTVTFYRGQTALGQLQSNNNKEKKPVTEIFTFKINASNKDDGVQYWCEAKLELGPDGPQPPPVVMSENISATVLYKPHLEGSAHPDPIIISEGDTLELNCSALGNPSPSYNWTVPPGIPAPSSDGVLTIKSITVAHKGQYICSVGNNVGTITVNYNVDVQVNYTMVIILGVIIGAVLVAFLLVVLYHYYYRHTRMGKYNMKDVLRLSTRHSALPTVE